MDNLKTKPTAVESWLDATRVAGERHSIKRFRLVPLERLAPDREILRAGCLPDRYITHVAGIVIPKGNPPLTREEFITFGLNVIPSLFPAETRTETKRKALGSVFSKLLTTNSRTGARLIEPVTEDDRPHGV